MAEQHAIVIRPEPFGVGFDITVEPKPRWGHFNQERPDYRAARRYAESLKVVNGWTIRDETEPSERSDDGGNGLSPKGRGRTA